MVVKIKNQKVQTSVSQKRKLKFENYEICLEVTKLDNKINYLKKKIGLTSIVLKKIIKNS